MRLCLAVLALASAATGASIRDIDFKNFDYPFESLNQPSVPNGLQWLPLAKTRLLSLRDGTHGFCAEPHCPSLNLDQVVLGSIGGLVGTSAIATLTYETGGTAAWQYVYVVALRSGEPRIVAWIESGIGANMGLRRATVQRGGLVLLVNDPDKQAGLCCSRGTLTYRYRWANGSFHQIGKPVPADDPPH